MKPTNGLHNGARVEIHPAADWFMRGERYGEIVKTGRLYYTVRGDRSGRTQKFWPADLTAIA